MIGVKPSSIVNTTTAATGGDHSHHKRKLSLEFSNRLGRLSINNVSEGYLTLLRAFTQHQHENTASFSITLDSGPFGPNNEYVCLQHIPSTDPLGGSNTQDHPTGETYKIPSAILAKSLENPATKLFANSPTENSTLTIKKSDNTYQICVTGKGVLFTLSHENDGLHLLEYQRSPGEEEERQIIRDGGHIAVTQVREDSTPSASTTTTEPPPADPTTGQFTLPTITQGDPTSLSIAYQTLENHVTNLVDANVITTFATQIITTAITNRDSTSLSMASQILKNYATNLGDAAVTKLAREIITTAIANGDSISLSIASQTLENHATKLGGAAVATLAREIITTAIANGNSRSLSIAYQTLENHATKLGDAAVATLATEIIIKATDENNGASLFIAKNMLITYFNKSRAYPSVIFFVGPIITKLIALKSPISLSLALELLITYKEELKDDTTVAKFAKQIITQALEQNNIFLAQQTLMAYKKELKDDTTVAKFAEQIITQALEQNNIFLAQQTLIDCKPSLNDQFTYYITIITTKVQTISDDALQIITQALTNDDLTTAEKNLKIYADNLTDDATNKIVTNLEEYYKDSNHDLSVIFNPLTSPNTSILMVIDALPISAREKAMENACKYLSTKTDDELAPLKGSLLKILLTGKYSQTGSIGELMSRISPPNILS